MKLEPRQLLYQVRAQEPKKAYALKAATQDLAVEIISRDLISSMQIKSASAETRQNADEEIFALLNRERYVYKSCSIEIKDKPACD